MLTLRLILVLVYTTQVTLSSWSAILSPGLLEGEYFLLITSKLPNQDMRKVPLTCVLNTNRSYCTFPGWLVSLYKEKTFLPFKINWSRTLNTGHFLVNLYSPCTFNLHHLFQKNKIFSLCNFLWLNVPCNQTIPHTIIKLKVLHWQQPPLKWKWKSKCCKIIFNKISRTILTPLS